MCRLMLDEVSEATLPPRCGGVHSSLGGVHPFHHTETAHGEERDQPGWPCTVQTTVICGWQWTCLYFQPQTSRGNCFIIGGCVSGIARLLLKRWSQHLQKRRKTSPSESPFSFSGGG